MRQRGWYFGEASSHHDLFVARKRLFSLPKMLSLPPAQQRGGSLLKEQAEGPQPPHYLLLAHLPHPRTGLGVQGARGLNTSVASCNAAAREKLAMACCPKSWAFLMGSCRALAWAISTLTAWAMDEHTY